MRQEQAIGLLIASLLTAIIAASVVLVPNCVGNEETAPIDSVWVDSLQHQWTQAHAKHTYKKNKRYPKYANRDTVQIRMQEFDPNMADSLTLRKVGFKDWQAKGILHYRAKGGRYRRPEDLKKLYGMTDSLYAALAPWIRILPMESDSSGCRTDSLGQGSDRKAYRDSVAMARYGYIPHEKRDTILELNRADTADLQYIRGIGPTIAKEIVIRRTRLGGYVSVAQLAEIPHVCVDSIGLFFTVDTTLIRFINVNHASVSQLAGHPYINYDQARQIYDLRHRRSIKNEEMLLKYGIFSGVELEKLRPYLRYDK